MPQIPQTFIDDLLSRIDIVELIGSHIHLKKAGSNFLALCPFHNEKTPSFTVSPSKQFFHCFGCGAHGSAIGFVMQFEHMEFIPAVEKLAAQLGLAMPHRTNEPKTSFAPLHDLMNNVAKLYQKHLTHSATANAYLKKRGISPKICALFNIGYAPKDWDHLQFIIDKKPELKQHLLTTGMLVQKNHRTHACFRDRIMFPINDNRGRIIGFGGRTMGDDLPKYLNSPETPLFHKGNELYGLYEAKKTSSLKELIVVEGYMDVIALVQYGITNAVATLGTAITSKQIQQLLRYSNGIIFCFDGDEAGRKAANRALENSLPLIHDGIQIKFLFLPEDEDPDSLIRKEGTKAFLQRINQAITLSEFILQTLSSKINLKTIDGRASLAKEAKTVLQKIKNSTFKQLLTEKIASIIQTDAKTLEEIESNKEIQPQTSITNLSLVQNAINILLHYPRLIEHIEDIEYLKELVLPDIDLFIKLILLLKNQANLTLGAILEHWRDNENLLKITTLAQKEPLLSADDLKHELINITQKLRNHAVEHVIKQLMEQAATRPLTQEEKQRLQQLISKQKNHD